MNPFFKILFSCWLFMVFSVTIYAQHDYTEPDVSPDGEHLVFCSNKKSKNALYISKIDGSNKKLLIDLEGYESTPNWSPNGNKIMFYLMGAQGGSDLYTINLDGSNVTNLSKGTIKDPESPVWISNKEIIFSSGNFPKKNIYKLNLTNGKQEQLTDLEGINYYPDINNNKLTFCKFSRDSKGIFILDLNSKELKQLTDQGEAPIFNKDATKIIYQGKPTKESVTGLRIIDLESGNVSPLTHNDELSELADLDYNSGFVYYQRKINGHFSIWRIKLDGTQNTKIIGD